MILVFFVRVLGKPETGLMFEPLVLHEYSVNGCYGESSSQKSAHITLRIKMKFEISQQWESD